MFEGPNYPKALEESLFDDWLEQGRNKIMPYHYLLILWDDLDQKYFPHYVEKKSEIFEYSKYGFTPEQQSLIAAYDLYSESRIV